MKLTIQYSGPFNSVTLPDSDGARTIHQVCTLAKISLASMDMRRAMYLKGLPALHADVKALRLITPGDQVSVAAKKGTKMAAKWSPARGAVRSEPFPLLRSVVRNGPEPSRARRCWARRSEPLTARTVLR